MNFEKKLSVIVLPWLTRPFLYFSCSVNYVLKKVAMNWPQKKRLFYWNERNDKKFKLGKSRNRNNSPFTASPRIWREARPAMFGSSMKITLVNDLVCLCNNGESGSNTHLWNSLLLLLFLISGHMYSSYTHCHIISPHMPMYTPIFTFSDIFTYSGASPAILIYRLSHFRVLTGHGMACLWWYYKLLYSVLW